MTLTPGLWGIETEVHDLASLVTRTLPVTVASVVLWDKPSLTLLVKAVETVRPVNRSLPVGVRVPLADATWHRAAFEGNEPVLLEPRDDRQLGIEQEAELTLIPDIRSMYLFPIRFAGETVGILVLGEARAVGRERFSSEKQQRCQTIVDEFVTTTAHAWEAWRLRRQVRAMSSMMQLVRGVSTARSFDDVLISLASEVADWLGMPVRGALLGTTGKDIRLLSRWQLPEDMLSDEGRQLFLAMTRSSPRGAEPITVTLAADDPLDPLAAIEPAARSCTRIGIPLMRDAQLIGVACLYLEEEIRLADWELEALRRRGEIAAVGVEAVTAARTVEAEQERLHRMTFELLTGYRMALLQELFASLTRSLPASVHQRLRDSLPGLVGQGSPTSETPGGGGSDLLSVVVNEVSAAFADLWEVTGPVPPVTMSLDVNEIVGRALRIARTSLEDRTRRRGVTVDVRFEPLSPPALVEGSLVLIGALVHVIESAVEAMPEGGEIRIRTGRENGHVMISVEDSGRPPAGDAGSARLARFSLQDPGLVLSLVQAIVQPHGGRAARQPGEASRNVLVLYLPVSSTVPGD